MTSYTISCLVLSFISYLCYRQIFIPRFVDLIAYYYQGSCITKELFFILIILNFPKCLILFQMYMYFRKFNELFLYWFSLFLRNHFLIIISVNRLKSLLIYLFLKLLLIFSILVNVRIIRAFLLLFYLCYLTFGIAIHSKIQIEQGFLFSIVLITIAISLNLYLKYLQNN